VDNSYRLVDKSEDGSKFDTAMDLEEKSGLITGDKLTTGLTLELPKSIADLVNSGECGTAVPAAVASCGAQRRALQNTAWVTSIFK
jgi:hypothetical protein